MPVETPEGRDGPITGAGFLKGLRDEGVTHVVGLPDNDTAVLFELLPGDTRLRLVRVTREGEAFAVAAGLWLGGAAPFVVLQNTGLLESGDALRGTASRMGVPLVMLVGYRGFAGLQARGRAAAAPVTRDELVRTDVDTAALMTEPTLAAWGVPFQRLDGSADRVRLSEAFALARAEERPVALLLCHALS